MMTTKKTIQEVKKHCVDNGYSEKARTQICAFLVGAKLKDTQDVLKFKIGEKTFEDFVNWYNTEEEELELERGRFVLIDNDAEVYPALILEVFEDACLTISDNGLFCVVNEMIAGYADVLDTAYVLERLADFSLYWDCDNKKLLPYWHMNKSMNEKDC